MLQYLVTVAKGAAQKLEVLGQLVSSLFDLTPGSHTHMKVPLWKKCMLQMLEVRAGGGGAHGGGAA
jgi:translation initiation factor 3 subunit C